MPRSLSAKCALVWLVLFALSSQSWALKIIKVDNLNPGCGPGSDLACNMQQAADHTNLNRVTEDLEIHVYPEPGNAPKTGPSWTKIGFNIDIPTPFSVVVKPFNDEEIIPIDCEYASWGWFFQSFYPGTQQNFTIERFHFKRCISNDAGHRLDHPSGTIWGGAAGLSLSTTGVGYVTVSQITVTDSIFDCTVFTISPDELCAGGGALSVLEKSGSDQTIVLNDIRVRRHYGNVAMAFQYSSSVQIYGYHAQDCYNPLGMGTTSASTDAFSWGGGLRLRYTGTGWDFHNMTFINNTAKAGGGMAATDCTVNFYNMMFINNTAFGTRGGNRGESHNGVRGDEGGGYYQTSCTSTMSGAYFENNKAERGGAISGYSSSLGIEHGTFINNSATIEGGVAAYSGMTPRFRNTTFNRYHTPDILMLRQITTYVDEPTLNNMRGVVERMWGYCASPWVNVPGPNQKQYSLCWQTPGDLTTGGDCNSPPAPFPDEILYTDYAACENLQIDKPWCELREGGLCDVPIMLSNYFGMANLDVFGTISTPKATIDPVQLSYSAVNWNVNQQMRIEVPVDNIISKARFERHRVTFTLDTGGAHAAWDKQADEWIDVVIEDDDNIELTYNPSQDITLAEGDSRDIKVRCLNPLEGPTDTIEYIVSSPASSGVEIPATTLSWTQADVAAGTQRYIQVSAVQDNDIRGDVTINLQFVKSGSLTHATDYGDTAQAVSPTMTRIGVTVQDNDRSIVTSVSSQKIGDGGTFSYTVTLGGNPLANTTVAITCSLPNCQVVPNSITFTPSSVSTALDYTKPRTVTVTVPPGLVSASVFTGTLTHTSSSSNAAASGLASTVSVQVVPSVTVVEPAWVFMSEPLPTVVTVSGALFGTDAGDVTSLTVGGYPCATFARVSAAKLTCTIAAGTTLTPGTGPVTIVTGTMGTHTQASPTFEVKALAPYVTSLSPVASVFSEATVVTIQGVYMGTGAADITTLKVAGFDCLSTLDWSDAKYLTCQVGPAPAASVSGPIEITSASQGQGVPSSHSYTFLPESPQLLDFTPKQAPFTTSGTAITLSGKYFGGAISDYSDILIAGQSCYSTAALVDAQTITCTIPSAPKGTAAARVTLVRSSSAQVQSTATFKYINLPPIVQAVSPKLIEVKSATASTGTTTPTTTIVITGTNLGSTTADIDDVKIGGTSCKSSVVLVNATSISCTAPPLTAGVYPVVIFVNGLNSTTPGVNPPTVTYFEKAAGAGTAAGGEGDGTTGFVPVVSSIHPQSAATKGGVQVIVSGFFLGIDFYDIESVMIGDVPCGKIHYESDERLFCTIPAVDTSRQGKSANVTVKTRSGGTSNSARAPSFSWLIDPPEVSGIKPKVIPVSGGTITITGSGFGDGTDAIAAAIGEIPCNPATYISATEITCQIPPQDASQALNASGITVTVGVTTGGMTPALSSNVELSSISYGQPCADSCGVNGLCISGQCRCGLGWTNAPACETPLVTLSGTTSTILTAQEDGEPARITVTMNRQPTAPVTISVALDRSASTLSQYSPQPADGIVFTRGAWEEPQVLSVVARQDYIRDGNLTFALGFLVRSDDQAFNGMFLPPRICEIQDSSPKVILIQPEISPINGTQMNITLEHLDPGFILVLSRVGLPDRRVPMHASRVRRVPIPPSAPIPTSSRRLLQDSPQTYPVHDLTIEIPEGEEGTYGVLSIVNQGGAMKIKDRAFYVTDKCPREGQWGAGADCKDCPTGAVCPGGYRMWAKPGFWTRGETSSFVEECIPRDRCLGTVQESGSIECAPTFTGELCGECISDYYMAVNGECIQCPASGEALPFIITDAVVWTLAAVAAVFVKDQISYSYLIMAIRMLQMVGGLGQMSDPSMPGFTREMYEFMHLFSGDYAFLKPDCINPTPYFTRFAIGLAYNFAIFIPTFLAIPLAWMIARPYYRSKMESGKITEEEMEMRINFYPDRWFRSFIVWLAVVYFSMTSRALEAVSCQRIGPTYYMITDPSSLCYGEAIGATILGVFIMIIVTIGFPLTAAIYLSKNQDRMWDDYRFKERWSMLYEFYKPGFSSFWTIEFVITTIVAASNSALKPHPKYQFSICVAVFALKFGFIVWKAPFYDWITNGLHLMMSIAYMVALNLNLIGRVMNFDIGVVSLPLAITLVSLIAITVLGILGFAGYRIIALEGQSQAYMDSDLEDEAEEQYKEDIRVAQESEMKNFAEQVLSVEKQEEDLGTAIMNQFASWFGFGGNDDTAEVTPYQEEAGDAAADAHGLEESVPQLYEDDHDDFPHFEEETDMPVLPPLGSHSEVSDELGGGMAESASMVELDTVSIAIDGGSPPSADGL